MARNGSGTFSLAAGNPVVTGTTISSTTHNTTMSDIANAITASIASDGQTTPTANLKMGGYKLTGLGAATVAGDAVRFEQVGALALAQGASASGPLASSGITGAAASGANTDITSLSSPALGAATATTQALGDNSTKVATTAFVLSNGSSTKIQSITSTQGTGALTFGLAATTLDFRSTTLTTGVPTTISTGALSLVLPSGGTLGAVTTVSARSILVAINNAGTVELAVVNIAGGNDLSETGVINTTAISAAATANNVFYSTTARTGVAYRVIGSVDAVNTAGAWGNPTLVQGYGGQALAAMSSLGYGQTWQNVTGSRALATTYYNTTGKPLLVSMSVADTATTQATLSATVSGVVVCYSLAMNTAGMNTTANATFVAPSGCSYSVATTGTVTLSNWSELR